jgi:hypothetical protein
MSLDNLTATNTIGGYTCGCCGSWVTNGLTHSCVGSTWQNPPIPPTPDGQRIAAALERIAAALEQLGKGDESA